MPSGGRFEGKFYGFPIGGRCFINRDCKVAPIQRYLAEMAGSCRKVRKNIVQYIGIALDESKRLQRLGGNKISLLAKYDYTEEMARAKCEQYGLLSPIYSFTSRGGCWFCPNQSIGQFCGLRRRHPELWEELRKLSTTPNLCSYGFKWGLTLPEVEARMNFEDRQMKLF